MAPLTPAGDSNEAVLRYPNPASSHLVRSFKVRGEYLVRQSEVHDHDESRTVDVSMALVESG